MLSCLQQGQLPGINEEGATGKLDNKGAIFIPGGLVYQDVDEKQVSYDPLGSLNETIFREKIRASMQYDNATLLFPDGLATASTWTAVFLRGPPDASTHSKQQLSNAKGGSAARSPSISIGSGLT
jgi:hypothetical protein